MWLSQIWIDSFMSQLLNRFRRNLVLQLTLHSKVVLHKQTVAQLNQKLAVFNGIQRLIAAVTRGRHMSLSQIIPAHTLTRCSLKICFNIILSCNRFSNMSILHLGSKYSHLHYFLKHCSLSVWEATFLTPTKLVNRKVLFSPLSLHYNPNFKWSSQRILPHFFKAVRGTILTRDVKYGPY
jgi:hypothetical protein